MSIDEHASVLGRVRIVGKWQHPYNHDLSEMYYANPKLPGVVNAGQALDYFASALYPNYQGTVANVGSLPGTGNPNDLYFVSDDGDGKFAAYVWQEIDNVMQWNKKYDVDFSVEGILAEAINRTQHMYLHKYGHTDLDSSGAAVVGDLAGQVVYGGDQANQNLTLYANAGDSGGGNTGFVQLGDNVRPTADNSFDLGTSARKFKDIFGNTVVAGTLTAAAGSITDTSGSISFGDENLSTTGTLASGQLTVSSDMVIDTGSITSVSGAISFGDENLTTTGNISGLNVTGTNSVVAGTMTLSGGSIVDSSGAISFGDENLTTTGNITGAVISGDQLNIDNLRLDGNTLSATDVNGNVNILANGTGVVDVQSAMTTLGQTVTGTVDITGQLDVDNISINSNTISSTDVNGDIVLDPNGTGQITAAASVVPNGAFDLGTSTNLFNDLFVSGGIRDASNEFPIADLLAGRSWLWRDDGETSAVQNGDVLTYDSVSGKWLAALPGGGPIDHTTLSNLTSGDAGHTQFLLLAGRAGGQDAIGGTAASENLTLESTSNATKGQVLTKDHFYPFTDASYAGSWSGTDLGGPSNNFRDIYLKGEARGLRLENFLFAGLPASSGQNVGRLVYATDTQDLHVDTGSALVRIGVNKFLSDEAFDGIQTVKNVDVSSVISDARNCIIQLLDNSNNFERIVAKIEATSASNVRITTNVPLAAANYRLIVIE